MNSHGVPLHIESLLVNRLTGDLLMGVRHGLSHYFRLIEEREPGGPKTTSGDYSRIIRHSHGEDSLLMGWTQRALVAWKELGEAAGEQIFVESGVAWFISGDGIWEGHSEERMREVGVPCERITPDEALRRWPTLGLDGLTSVLYEPTAGFLRAGNGVRAAARILQREGGVIERGRATPAGRHRRGRACRSRRRRRIRPRCQSRRRRRRCRGRR